jgi:hypothetical protein
MKIDEELAPATSTIFIHLHPFSSTFINFPPSSSPHHHITTSSHHLLPQPAVRAKNLSPRLPDTQASFPGRPGRLPNTQASLPGRPGRLPNTQASLSRRPGRLPNTQASLPGRLGGCLIRRQHPTCDLRLLNHEIFKLCHL